MMTLRRSFAMMAPLALLLLCAACNEPRTLSHRSNLVDYLYPRVKGKAEPLPLPQGVRLRIPLKVGLAFVPSQGGYWRASSVISATAEKPLLEVLKKAFVGRSWVQDVKVIPSTYLMPQGGFDNLEAVCRMFNVDVVALVSVDQVQYTDPKWYSFAYYSIVGAYVLPGDKNDTRTLIDAAVFHPQSRAFILRAPGTSYLKGSSTWASREERLREQSGKGLEIAMVELAANLDKAVEEFKADVKSGERKDVDLIDQKGQSLRETGGRNWGGSFAWYEALAGLALLGASLVARRRP